MRYRQILKLRNIWLVCTSQSFTLEDISKLEILIVEFVKIQEDYVYQREFNRLPACTSQVHLLLHLPQQIKTSGPPRAYWSFPVERICADVVDKLKSKKHPYRNLTLEMERSEKVCIMR